MTTRPTIAQIADLSGVSIATVSRFLNNSASVRAATGRRILKAAKELNYPVAEVFSVPELPLMTTERKEIILINIPSVSNPFYNDVVKGIQDQARRRGYYTLLNVQHINFSTEAFFFDMLSSLRPCGAVILNHLDRKYFDMLYKTLPFVQCCEYMEDQNLVSYTSIDDVQAAKSAIDYILSTGHKKVGIMTGPERYKYSRHRLQGYLQALKDADIPVNDSWIVQIPDIDFNVALSSAYKLMSQPSHPDAVFAVSDVLAAAAIRGCRNAGLSVPGDVIVTGFDNIDISQATTPTITTIDQPKYQLGCMACEFLIEKLTNPEAPPKQVLLNTELIIRESTMKIE